MADGSPLEYFICGGFGGICTVLVGHPMDTIKVRLQTVSTYNGFLDCFRRTISTEGVTGLYKGMGAPLVGIVPIFAISFAGYRIGKKAFLSKEPKYWQYFAAGAFSGLFTTIITTPGERIKCLMQVQGIKTFSGPLDCAQKLYKHGGVASLYRGSLATVLRDVPACGVYFLTYELLKTFFISNKDSLTISQTVICGGFSGVTYWFIGMPFDVVKSVQQTVATGKSTFSEVAKEVFVKKGVTVFYKGLLPVLIRSFPANAACFLGFDFAKNILEKLMNTSAQNVNVVEKNVAKHKLMDYEDLIK